MYEFYHNTLEPHWQNKVQLHYMDTDSFVLVLTVSWKILLSF